MTTTTSLFDLPASLGVVDVDAVSEAARSATLAQNMAAATRLEAAHVLVDRIARGAESGSESPGGAVKRPAYARLDPESRARDHLVAACQLSCWHAARLVTAGRQIHTRLPRLRSAVARGLWPEQLAIEAACRLSEVPDAIVASVERDVVGEITEDLNGGHRPTRASLDGLIDRAVERHDPAAAEDAVDAAAESRGVRFRVGRNGMASMWAHLPVADAELLRQRIEAEARAAAEDGVPRTMDQLRADALVSLAVVSGAGAAPSPHLSDDSDVGIELGEVRVGSDLPRPSLGNSAAAGLPIRISVIASAARGLPNRVEFVHGAYSSFDWLCRELLEGDDATVRFEVIDPTPGVSDSPDRALRYTIPQVLAERVRLRDGTCRYPGCAVPAEDCDVDHVIAFDHTAPDLGGPTSEWNLMCLCRKHHREKTFGTNSYRPGPLGELIIFTDTGHEHRTRPRGPLARARDEIRERAWDVHLERLIDEDWLLTNPPGTDRRRCSVRWHS